MHAFTRPLFLAPLLGALASAAQASVTFTDVTAAAGIAYVQHSAWEPPMCLLLGGAVCEADRMSGGAAAADADGDGDIDLYVTRLDAHDLLYCNQLADSGSPTFQDCSQAAGFDLYDLQSNGAVWGDIDNDGDADLYVTTIGSGAVAANARFHLFLNDGSGHFSEAAVARGADLTFSGDRSGYSATFGDYDHDGWLDLHVNEWHPTTRHHLLRNHGAGAPGHFSDVTAAAGLDPDLAPSCTTPPCPVFAFASVFTDLDQDGWPDLVVVADFSTSRLYWNDGDGTFTEFSPTACLVAEENGMGVSVGDYDGDGDFDVFVTSIHDAAETCETQICNWGYTGNRMFRNDGNRLLCDATDAAGVREGFWGWGSVFLDYDNDGDLDLSMTNGVDFPDNPADAAFNADPMRFWENDGSGSMTEVSSSVGVTDTGSGKGLLSFDYDEDGDLDLFVVNNAAAPVLYRNDGGNQNDWLRVRLRGTQSNRDGVGARIELRATPTAPTQLREIRAGGLFLAQSELAAHFGLGPGPGPPVHEVEVTWPKSGRVVTYTDVARNGTLLAVEPLPGCGFGPGLLLLPLLLRRGRARR